MAVEKSVEFGAFCATKPAPHLNSRRESLKREHRAILSELAAASKHGFAPGFPERVAALRLSYRQVMIERIVITEMLSRKMLVINFRSITDAIRANRKLTDLCTEVATTLRNLEQETQP
jgi:hypothetical protein